MSDRESRSQPRTPESEERLLARRYMLGGLSDQQQDEVERRFLFDPAFEDIVLEEETDLFDALAAGTLSSDNERALRLWASAQQRTEMRLEAAFAFNRLTSNTAQNSVSSIPASRNWLDGIRAHRFSALWLSGVAAAVLALVAATLWVTRRHSDTQIATSVIPAQPAPIAAPSASPSPVEPLAPATAAPARAESTVTLVLMAEETRSASAPPRLLLKSGTSKVTLQLASQTGLPAGRHAVELTGADGLVVQPKEVHSRRLHGQNFLEVTLDATALRPGEYTVLLHEKDAAGAAAPLTYRFQIAAP